MYKMCKTEQSALRQHLLEEGLLKAMASQSYEDITISDLCSQINIPRKAFYRYFSGKDGALHALIDHRLMEFETHTGSLKKGSNTLDLEGFFGYWQGQKPLLDALERSGLSGVLIERSISHALTERSGPWYSSLRYSKEYADTAISFTVCGLMSMMVNWHHMGFPRSAREMAEIATMMLTRPLFCLD